MVFNKQSKYYACKHLDLIENKVSIELLWLFNTITLTQVLPRSNMLPWLDLQFLQGECSLNKCNQYQSHHNSCLFDK